MEASFKVPKHQFNEYMLKEKGMSMHVMKYYIYEENMVDVKLEDKVAQKRGVLLGYRIIYIWVVKVLKSYYRS